MVAVPQVATLGAGSANYSLASNATLNSSSFVGYVQEPDGRGTASLLISCLLTLVTCVWSALHLNVPRPGQTYLEGVWVNVIWIFMGIFAPETVIMAAFRQWKTSRALSKIVKMVSFSDETSSTPTTERPSWTPVHSFFACSGGFAFESKKMTSLILGEQAAKQAAPVRLTFTSHGLALLAELDLLPSVSEEEIQDKSKANGLAKSAVIIQAVWMIIQVLGRIASRLPVTLLEINTVAHVLCAFAMYLMWWHKPMSPQAPIILRDDRLVPIVTCMLMMSEISSHIRFKERKFVTAIHGRQAPMVKSTDGDVELASNKTKCPGLERMSGVPPSCLLLSQCVGGSLWWVMDGPRAQPDADGDRERWLLIEEAFKEYPELIDIAKRYVSEHVHNDDLCVHLRPAYLVAEFAPNAQPRDTLTAFNDEKNIVTVLCIGNIAYGAFHAVAWNEHFPTIAEKWMWWGSVCCLMLYGALWALSMVLGLLDVPEIVIVILGCFALVGSFLAVFSRAFLVIEAFASLRKLPAAAYQSPQWINILPHL